MDIEFIDYGPMMIRRKIPVKQLGITKLIVVRTKKNGGVL